LISKADKGALSKWRKNQGKRGQIHDPSTAKVGKKGRAGIVLDSEKR